MKKWIAQTALAAFALILISAALTGCAASQSENTVPAVPSKTISPLAPTIDVANLDNCTAAVSLEKGDAYVDDTGVARMKVTVYDYDRFDLVDISQLTVGDAIVLRGEEVRIFTLERERSGQIRINGGRDADGYTLVTDDSGVYFERLENDAHAWNPLGAATVRIHENFVCIDNADPDAPTTWYAGDFLTNSGISYFFTPENTQLTMENGQAISMTRVYTP